MGVKRDAFCGGWRIVEMSEWDCDYLDEAEPAFLTITRGGQGTLRFGYVQAEVDSWFVTRDGLPAVEFSWHGSSEGDEMCGRGWLTAASPAELRGRIFFHQGDESTLVARRASSGRRQAGLPNQRMRQRRAR